MVDQRGPWRRHSTRRVISRALVSVHSDQVTDPGGQPVTYDWVHAPDLVRVAALGEDGMLVVAQHHYLPDQRLWQLPGGHIEQGETPAAAAKRELAEETGRDAQHWAAAGAVWPLPGLSPVRVHLWEARGLHQGDARPTASEADLTVIQVDLDQAVQAALDGTMGCAASSYLVLVVAEQARREQR